MKRCYNQTARTHRQRINHCQNYRRNVLLEFCFVRAALDDMKSALAANAASLQETKERKSKRSTSRARRLEHEIGVKSAAVAMLEADEFKLAIAVKRMAGNGKNKH